MPEFQQHDATDCGAACLRYVFHTYGLSLSMPAIRQRSGTSKSGTTALGLVDTAQNCGFDAKGVRCRFEDLRSLTLPGVAHVLTESGRPHYIVVSAIKKNALRIMDPAVGRVQTCSIERFRAMWTNVFVVLAPSLEFKPSKKSDTPWLRLLALLRPQKAVLCQAFVGIVLSTLLSLSGAVFIQKIVDNVIVDGNRNLLRLLGFGMLAVLLIRILIGYFQSLLMLRSAQRIDAGLILGYYKHLMRLPQSFFDTMRVGEITSRVRDAVAIRDFLNGTILSLILNPLILIAALAAMFAYSWHLAVFSLALVPGYAVIYFVSDWLNRRYQRDIMEKSADFDSQLVESLHAMSVVRSCGLEDEMSYRSETRLVRLLKKVWIAANGGLLVSGSGSLLTQAYSVGLLWIGADLVLSSQLSAGELMSCNALAGYITGPIVSIIGMNASIRTATTATDRLYEILDIERERDEGEAVPLLKGEFKLALEGVQFRYPGRTAVLTDINLDFSSGTLTALAGKSGCGKSTILGLLQRHYVPDGGRIVLGGVDLQYIKLSALRSMIAFVPQRIDLLAGTVLENLAPSEAQPDMERLLVLCRQVGILEFIESLPRGFQTLVTENGANLSGGQKQRFAVVRALYANAPIVLMDEPSSALDSASEEMLMEALREMRAQGKLVILAVHNRRLLSLCDRVVEMDLGRVVNSYSGADLPPERLGLTTMLWMGDKHGLDKAPEEETPASVLHRNLRTQAAGGMLFGQLDANLMGVTAAARGWYLADNMCDILEVTGKWPGLFAYDVVAAAKSADAPFKHVLRKAREGYDHGGVISISWYPENLVSGGQQRSGCGVAELSPGGPYHAALREELARLASDLESLRDAEGRQIPIMFWPWPQQNADYLWWGRSRCTAIEYHRLFRFTVAYLREKGLANLLFGFSVAANEDSLQSAIDRYPGDDYVDLIGVQSFGDDSPAHTERIVGWAAEAVEFAEARGKVAGIVGIGFDRGNDCAGLVHCLNTNWLRDGVIAPLAAHPVARRTSFITFWRNEANKPSVFHLPPSGSPHARCLQALAEDSFLAFADRSKIVYGTALDKSNAEEAVA